MPRLCAVLALLTSLPAAAQMTLDEPRETVERYFQGELDERWAFGGLGLASVGSGAGLLVAGRPATIGASIPLFAVGLIQLALGIGLWVRTPPQVAALEAQLAADPQAFLDAERARMRRVNGRFGIYRVIETSLFFAGGGLAGIGGITGKDALLGAGFGLAAEAITMLILDLFAEIRGETYERALLGFSF